MFLNSEIEGVLKDMFFNQESTWKVMHDFEQKVESHRSYEHIILWINRIGWSRSVFFFHGLAAEEYLQRI